MAFQAKVFVCSALPCPAHEFRGSKRHAQSENRRAPGKFGRVLHGKRAGLSVMDALSAVIAKREEIAIVPFECVFRLKVSICRHRQTQMAEIATLFSGHLLKSVC